MEEVKKQPSNQEFNDSELKRIMSEIENLEGQVTGEVGAPAPSANPIPLSDLNSKKTQELEQLDQELQNTFSNIPRATSTNLVRYEQGEDTAAKIQFSLPRGECMKFEFLLGGELVELSVGGPEGLVVKLSGGTTFIVPLKMGKKAA